MKFGLTPWSPSTTSRWDPFDDMRQMQQRLNRLFGDSEQSKEMIDMDTLSPLIDIKEDDKNIIVTTDLPGVSKEDIDIDIKNDRVWIKANTHKESKEEKEGYLMRERTYSRFARAFNLPSMIKEDEASAKLENGVLTITMPKAEIEEKHRIMIE
ncbi:Hsp20/alpha crystallin family protein [Methanolobus sediminis]|uniref:Hsp20/alpha crystallin family protein n=1 Tax=Methanolobus sediminis TaxID=3072978 RepID=A0AA51YKS1_9EURY|nr:Hsp20/alpha crystallin family protein [Methanolobus sediminis]WMW24192.1 Hsp20/alpha crystallin family protein [Methanolobus sediminis]